MPFAGYRAFGPSCAGLQSAGTIGRREATFGRQLDGDDVSFQLNFQDQPDLALDGPAIQDAYLK